MENTGRRHVIALHRMMGGRVEALEFRVLANTAYKGVPLKDIPVRPNYLIAVITHTKTRCSSPAGTINISRGTPSCS